MEEFGFQLNLVEKMSGPANKAADALTRVADALGKASKPKSLGFGDDIQRTMGALAKLNADPKGFQMMAKANKALSDRKKMLLEEAGIIKKTAEHKESFFGGLTSGAKGQFALISTAAAAGELLAEGAMKIGETLLEAAHKVVEIFTEGFAKAIEEGGKEETKRLAFKLSLGKEGGKESLEDIARFSKMTAFTNDEVAKMLLPMRRAGFDQQGARTAFSAASDIQAGGGMAAPEAMEAFKNIKLRGGVSRRQLVGMQVSAPDFYKSIAKKFGISEKEAEKKAGPEGGMDPQQLLNMVYAGIEKTQGGKLGTGGIAAGNTMEARLHKLGDLPNEYFKKMVDSPGFAKLEETFGRVLEKLDPEGPVGTRVIASLERMFDKIIGWVDELSTDEGLDKLTATFEGVVGFLENAVELAGKLVDLVKATVESGSAVAGFFNKVTGGGGGTGSADLDKAQSLFNQGRLSPDDLSSMVAKMSPRQREDAAQRLGITLQPTINVQVEAAKDEDPAHTGQKIAEEANKHMTNWVERYAQEAGAR